MSRTLSFKSLIFLIVVLLSLPLAGYTDIDKDLNKSRAENKKTYSMGKKNGWWWYKEEKVEPEPREKEKSWLRKKLPNITFPIWMTTR